MWVYMIIASTPVEFIKKWRKREGLTQADVAKALCISNGTIGDFERGRRTSPRFCFWFSVLLSEFDRLMFFDLVALHYSEDRETYKKVQQVFNELRERGKLHQIGKDDITMLRAKGLKVESQQGKWKRDGKIRKRNKKKE